MNTSCRPLPSEAALAPANGFAARATARALRAGLGRPYQSRLLHLRWLKGKVGGGRWQLQCTGSEARIR